MPFCHKCGSKLEEGDKFCVKCGATVKASKSALTDKTIKEISTSVKNEVKQETEQVIVQKTKISVDKSEKKTGKAKPLFKDARIPIIIATSVLIIVLIGVIVVLQKKHSSVKTEVEYVDPNEYFSDKAEIKSVVPAKKAKKNMTEKAVLEELKSRGLADYPVATNYSMSGDLIEEKEISEKSSEKHPIYETYYVDSKDEVWIINVIDGVITAMPSVYNRNHIDSVPLVVSETEEIASYDCSTNSFYRTVPKSTALNVHIVGRVDASTLESFNLEG